jgi:general stress protein 26
MTIRKYIVVGTVNRSGRPHVAPSSFVWWAAQVWLPTESGAARVRHLRSSPFVSLALTEGEDRHHAAVLMEGPAELTPIEDAPEDPGRLWESKFSHRPEWADIWICARPERLFSYAAEDWTPPPIS